LAEALFTKEAGFLGAQFIERANFVLVQFKKEANFSGAHFTKEVLFSRAEIEVSPSLSFKNSWIDDQEHFVLPTNNLSNVSFANTDISRVRFGVDVVWGDGSKIRDERELEYQLIINNVAEGIRLRDILSVYRSIFGEHSYMQLW
jgi:uncharacterized protein YjbI with pentapeptide repeats